MLKIFILAAIVILCSFIGYLYGEDFKKRYLELSELMRCFIDMENEIIYSYRALPDVLGFIANKSSANISSVFSGVSELLMRGDIEDVNEAFKFSLNNERKNLAMKDEDFDIILDLSKSLGDTDIIGQGQIFSLAKEKLSRSIDMAEKDYRTNCKMYKILGFYIGIMIAVFLL